MILYKKKGVLGVIPVRWGSTRLPGKPLADINGVPMVVRVYRQASAAHCFSKLLVACDDQRILAVCRDYGVPAEMTGRQHSCGTERVREVALRYPYRRVLNIQGDEPFFDPAHLDTLASLLPTGSRERCAATLAAPLRDPRLFRDPSVVKLVRAADGNACWFSRSPLPYAEDGVPEGALCHLGLYGFTRALLQYYPQLPLGRLEQQERLEQLRLLEAGIPVRVELVENRTLAVDTPEDLAAARRFSVQSGV